MISRLRPFNDSVTSDMIQKQFLSQDPFRNGDVLVPERFSRTRWKSASMLIASFAFVLLIPGQLGVGAHLVRGLPGAQLLPEEPADQRDAHRHPVPLPVLDGPRHSQLRSNSAGLPQVRARTPAGSGPSFPPFTRVQGFTETAPFLKPKKKFEKNCV